MAGNTKAGFIAGIVAGAAAGALVVWALAGGAPRGGAPATSALRNVAAAAPAPAASARPATPPGTADVAAATPGDAAALLACQQALAAVEARAGKANAALHDTSGKLAEAKAIQAEDEGTPLEPPPGMPDRFMDPKFARKQVQALFDGVGGGEVTSVDCTEFPCLVYGDVTRDGPKAINRTIGALVKASPDGWTACDRGQWMSAHDEGFVSHYAYAVCPQGYGKKLTPAQSKRISWRIQQMEAADQGP